MTGKAAEEEPTLMLPTSVKILGFFRHRGELVKAALPCYKHIFYQNTVKAV